MTAAEQLRIGSGVGRCRFVGRKGLSRGLKAMALAGILRVGLGCVAGLLPGIQSSAAAAPKRGTAGPEFRLVDQNAKAVTNADLAAKPTVVHFGFTHCPVICPTTLSELAGLIREMGDASDRINFVFVTVDPERDTPEVLKAYIASFDDRIVGLTGDVAQVTAIATGLGASFKKGDVSNGDYVMDHSVNGVLMAKGWQHHSVLYMGSGAKPANVLKALRELVNQQGAAKPLPAAPVEPIR